MAVHADLYPHHVKLGYLVCHFGCDERAVGVEPQHESFAAGVLGDLEPILAHEHLPTRYSEKERAELARLVKHLAPLFGGKLLARSLMLVRLVAMHAVKITPVSHLNQHAE